MLVLFLEGVNLTKKGVNLKNVLYLFIYIYLFFLFIFIFSVLKY
jgi:hypothetical protein